jgi:hypothetical protein
MRNVHNYRYVDAKISNFIHRKLATLGEVTSNTSRRATSTSGIYYEPLAMPRNGQVRGAK